MFLLFCSWRHTRVPSVIGAPRTAHFMAADCSGPWFMQWIAEKICGWKFLAQVTFLGLDLEYSRWVASDFWVFIPYQVEVSVARLKRKFISWRRISSSSSVFPYGLVVLGCASLHRELPLCGLPVSSCSAGKHLNAELGIVCRLLLGLG